MSALVRTNNHLDYFKTHLTTIKPGRLAQHSGRRPRHRVQMNERSEQILAFFSYLVRYGDSTMMGDEIVDLLDDLFPLLFLIGCCTFSQGRMKYKKSKNKNKSKRVFLTQSTKNTQTTTHYKKSIRKILTHCIILGS